MTVIDRRYSVAEGQAIKSPCVAATTANITLAALQTIDGVSLAENDRVLVKNQSTVSENGIYAASSGNWSRTRDFDGAYDVVTGTVVYIASGSTNSGHSYLVSTTGDILPGASNIAFTQDQGTVAAGVATAAAATATTAAATATSEAAIATAAVAGLISGSLTSYGAIINGTISESHAASAVTFALKTLAGADPSVNDPVLVAFRNAAAGTGNYVYRTITTPVSVTISSGSTMGFSNGTPGKLWLPLFDDAGTVRMGAINCLSGKNIYPLGQMPLASSTAEGGAGASDSAHVFYTGTAVTSKAYILLGYASYEAGLTTAGTWDASPTRIQLFGAGVPLPGQSIRTVHDTTTTAGTTTSATYAALTNGQSLSITLTSAANLVRVSNFSSIQLSTSSTGFIRIVRGGSTAVGNPIIFANPVSGVWSPASIVAYDAPGSTSSQTYSFQGTTNAGTLSYPPSGGTQGSLLTLEEIMT